MPNIMHDEDEREDRPERVERPESIADQLSFKSRFVLVFGEVTHSWRARPASA